MPVIEILAIVLGTIALVAVWISSRRTQALQAKLDRLQSTLFETRQEQRAVQERFEQRMAALDVALQKATGNLRFDPAMSLTRLYELEPRAENILAAFHIGGCADCAVDEHSSLAAAVRERGADLDRVLEALNSLPANGDPVDLRVPNVKFSM